MQKSNLFALSAITMACAMAVSGMAQAAEAEQAKDEKVHQLQAVEVEEAYERTGEIKITEAELKMQPSANHSINDAFRAESSVQFDINSRSGMAGAEITPPQISIRGSRPHENSYLINGVTNNNNINPGHWDHTAGMGDNPPSGDMQGIMITTDLVDNVKLLSENVSAEYGDFTGGVIDARIRDARADRWHIKAWTRHTRDSWAQQHFVPGAQEDNETPVATDAVQKEFKKTTVGLTMDGPLFDGKLGALVSYQKVHSSTPQWQKYGTTDRSKWDRQKSTRDLENLVVRLNTDPSNDFYVSSTIMYAPYEAEVFGPQVKDLSYTHKGGGWTISVNTRANLSIGTWTNDFGWNQSEASSEQDLHDLYYIKKALVPVDWTDAAIAQQGGFGSFKSQQDSYNFKSILSLNPVDFLGSQHSVRMGLDLIYRESLRSHDGHNLYYANNAVLKPGHTGSTDGVYGDLVWKSKTYVPAYEKNHHDLTTAAFIEDTIKYDRFTIRPGVRASYDDITNDLNFAPRFKFDADVLNDGRFHLNAGYNRYYGNQILDYALRDNAQSIVFTRPVTGSVIPEFGVGTQKPPKTFWNIDDLVTPYSDEFVLGASAKLWETKFNVQGVIREYKDQLQPKLSKTADKKEFYTMVNNGESSYKGITLTAEKSFDFGVFGKHISEFGVTHSELETNSRELSNWAMLDNMEDAGTRGYEYSSMVQYNGQVMNYSELPAGNFNSDWVLTYNHSASFMDDRLRATMWMRWESPSDRVRWIKDNQVGTNAEGLPIKMRVFEAEENKALFNADLSVAYDLIKTANSTLTINMDVTNLFDDKTYSNSNWRSTKEYGSYSMGRQFFLGMSYEY